MIRALTILATIVALAVSAAPASAGTSKNPPPRGTAGYTHMEEVVFAATASSPLRTIDNIDLRVGVKDGSSNTVLFAERNATAALENTMVSGYNAKARTVRSFSIDVGTSEALRRSTATLENTMVSSRKAKPRSKPNKGHGRVHAMWDITSGTKA